MTGDDAMRRDAKRPANLPDPRNLPPLGFLWRFGGWWRWLILALSVGGMCALVELPWMGFAMLGCAAGLLWFFRNPSRASTADTLSVVSPVDGLVDDVAVSDAAPGMQGEALRIGIVTSPLGVHTIRAPVSGTAGETRTLGLGGSTAAPAPGSEIWFCDAAGRPVRLCHFPATVSRGGLIHTGWGNQIQAGVVIGRTGFKSRVEIWLPITSGYSAAVWRESRVWSGVTILAQIHARGIARPFDGVSLETAGTPGKEPGTKAGVQPVSAPDEACDSKSSSKRNSTKLVRSHLVERGETTSR